MQSQIDWLTERVRLLTKQQFGFSSEKRIGEDFRNQLSMCFNEAELTEDISAEEEKITVREYTKKCRSGSVEDVIPEGTPVETIEHRLSEEERTCEECGIVMEEIGCDVRLTLVILPPPMFVREERFYTCACRKCDKKNDHTPMKQARVPAVLPGSFAPPEATAHKPEKRWLSSGSCTISSKASVRNRRKNGTQCVMNSRSLFLKLCQHG